MAKKNLLKNIEVRVGRDGTESYRVRLINNGKTYSATRDTLTEALSWRDDAKYKLKNNIPLDGDVPSGDMTIGKATDKFISGSTGKAESTVRGYVWSQTQILKYFGEDTLLSSITQSRIYDYVSHRTHKDGVGASKIRQELSLIKMVYDTAKSWDIDIDSPERNINRPRKQKLSREEKLERVIKIDELIPFLEKVRSGNPHKWITKEAYHKKFYDRNKKLYLYLIFLLHTGMRPSEAAFMRWDKPTAKYIKEARLKKYHAGYVDVARGGFSNIGTKTQPRFVPGHPIAMQIIKSIKRDGSFVFIPDEHGQKRKPYRYYRSAFETARSNTLLKDGGKLRGNIDFYSFRHTARSRMAVCGVQDSAAETIIGHEGDKMQAVYTHYDDGDLIEEIKKLNYPSINI